VVLEGEVFLKSDLDRIKEILQGNEFVVNLVTLSQDTQRILARRIKDEINIAGIEVTTVKDRIVLKGEVGTEDEQQRAEKIAAIYVDKGAVVNVI
jgi:Flp pilus assembly secretin CpaC